LCARTRGEREESRGLLSSKDEGEGKATWAEKTVRSLRYREIEKRKREREANKKSNC
jgi:hypothetical protein